MSELVVKGDREHLGGEGGVSKVKGVLEALVVHGRAAAIFVRGLGGAVDRERTAAGSVVVEKTIDLLILGVAEMRVLSEFQDEVAGLEKLLFGGSGERLGLEVQAIERQSSRDIDPERIVFGGRFRFSRRKHHQDDGESEPDDDLADGKPLFGVCGRRLPALFRFSVHGTPSVSLGWK